MDEKKLRYIRRPSFKKRFGIDDDKEGKSQSETFEERIDQNSYAVERKQTFRSSFLTAIHELNFQNVSRYLESEDAYQLSKCNIIIDSHEFPKISILQEQLPSSRKNRVLEVSAAGAIILSEFSADMKEVLLSSIRDKIGHLMLPCDSDGRTPLMIAFALNDTQCAYVICKGFVAGAGRRHSMSSDRNIGTSLRSKEGERESNEFLGKQNESVIEIADGIYEVMPKVSSDMQQEPNLLPGDINSTVSDRAEEFRELKGGIILDLSGAGMLSGKNECNTRAEVRKERLSTKSHHDDEIYTIFPFEIVDESQADRKNQKKGTDELICQQDEKGTLYSFMDENGWNCLHYATFNHSYQLIDFALSRSDMSKKHRNMLRECDFNGQNCLHLLMQHKIFENTDSDYFQNNYDFESNYNTQKLEHEGINCTNFAKRILDYGVDVNSVDKKKQTPLHLAIKNGCVSCVRLLLSSGASTSYPDEFGRYPVHHAVIHSPKIRHYAERVSQLHERKVFHSLTDFVDSSAKGNQAELPCNGPAHKSIEIGAREVGLSESDTTPTSCKIINLLLEYESAVYYRDRDERSALHYAGLEYDFQVLKRLLYAGSNFNEQDKFGKTVLHYLASFKVDDMRAWNLLLCDFGADPNARDSKGRTFVHEIFSWEHSEDNERFIRKNVSNISALLNVLDSGKVRPKYNIPDLEGITIVHLCLRKIGSIDSYGILGRLFSKGCNLNTPEYGSGMTPLAYALNAREAEQNIREMFKIYPHIARDRVDSLGKNLLHHAARCGTTRDVKDLIDLKLGVNTRDLLGRIPLQEAILSIKDDKGVDKVLLLIEAGSDIRNKDNLGISPIHDACSLTYKDAKVSAITTILHELLKRGANIDSQDFRGRTPLHIVASSNSLPVCQLLIKNKANTSVVDMKKRTPLHEAVRGGSEEIVMLLIENGCGIEKCDVDGNSILHEAAGRNLDEKIIKILLSSKRVVRLMMHTTNSVGHSPLLCSLNNAHFKTARMFILHGLVEPNDLESSIEYLQQKRKFDNNIISLIGKKLSDMGIIGKASEDYIGFQDCHVTEARGKFGSLLQCFEFLCIYTDMEKERDLSILINAPDEKTDLNYLFGNLRRLTHKIVSELGCDKKTENLAHKTDCEWEKIRNSLFGLISSMDEDIYYVSRKIKLMQRSADELSEIYQSVVPGSIEGDAGIPREGILTRPEDVHGENPPGIKSNNLMVEIGDLLLEIFSSFLEFHAISKSNFQRILFGRVLPQGSTECQYRLLENKLLKQENRIWRKMINPMGKVLSEFSSLRVFSRIRADLEKLQAYLDSKMKTRDEYRHKLGQVESILHKRSMCKNTISVASKLKGDILNVERQEIQIESELRMYRLEGRPIGETETLEKELKIIREQVKKLKLRYKGVWESLTNLACARVLFDGFSIYENCDFFWDYEISQELLKKIEETDPTNYSYNLDSFMKLNHSTLEKYVPSEESIKMPYLPMEMDRKLRGYESTRRYKGQMICAEWKGNPCTLKYFHLCKKEQKIAFTNQVCILSKLHHPAIARFEGQFIENKIGFLHFDICTKRIMKDWISSHKGDLLGIRNVFRKLLNGIIYLHQQNIVHRNLDLDSIVFANDDSPIICQFDYSTDLNSTISRVASQQAFENISIFVAPELLLSCEAAPKKADVWSFGVLLFHAHYPSLRLESIVVENNNFPIPKHEDDTLVDLLQNVLKTCPSERPSAVEALDSPYFSSDKFFKRTKQLWDTESKISIFRNHVSGMRNHRLKEGRKIEISISRENIVDEVIHAFAGLHAEQLLHPLKVKFRGEHGQDMVHTLAGGLTSEMYTLFFESLLSPQSRLFECAPEGESPAIPSYIPKAGYINDPWGYFVIGTVLTKCLIDGVAAPISFPSFLFKYLLGNEVMTLDDLEQYNWQLAKGLRQMLSTQNVQDVIPYTFEGLMSGGEDVDVTDENKHRFVELKVNHTIYNCREKQLQAFRNGFFSITEVSSLLTFFNHRELEMLSCGEGQINTKVVIANLVFSPAEDDPRWEVYNTDSGSQSTTAKDLIKIIHNYDRESLVRFVRFATAKVRIPEGGFDPKIRIMHCATSNLYPKGHTCFHSIALPDYKSYKVLEEKLKEALFSEGFGMD